jgi:hypothetical protein
MAQLSGPTEEDLSVYLAGFGIVAMEKIVPVTQERVSASERDWGMKSKEDRR